MKEKGAQYSDRKLHVGVFGGVGQAGRMLKSPCRAQVLRMTNAKS